MKTFTAGQSLQSRSICDYDCIFKGIVTKRTAKTVTIRMDGLAYDKTRKIHHDEDGNEYIFPLGQYSMAPIFRA